MRNYAEIKPDEKEIVKGLLMGDGSIAGGKASPNANSFFTLQMTNKKFLNHLKNELNHITTNLRKQRTAQKSVEVANSSLERQTTNAKSYYELKFSRHPYFSNLRSEWYGEDGKKFPKESFSPQKVKMWYVCDGSYTRKRARISALNEKERMAKIVKTFEEKSLHPNISGGDIYFSVEETKKFFNYIGEPPPGFKHKWAKDI